MELGIYIHIPFCIKKCDYCDFISYTNCYDLQEKYVKKLIEEIEENRDLLKNNFISTIYIGGGTPSSIKPEFIKKILDKIYEICEISQISEKIKIETTKKAIEYANFGLTYQISSTYEGLLDINDDLTNQICDDFSKSDKYEILKNKVKNLELKNDQQVDEAFLCFENGFYYSCISVLFEIIERELLSKQSLKNDSKKEEKL